MSGDLMSLAFGIKSLWGSSRVLNLFCWQLFSVFFPFIVFNLQVSNLMLLCAFFFDLEEHGELIKILLCFPFSLASAVSY